MLANIFLFLNLGTSEIIFVLLVVVMFFGSKKIPELARGLGRGMREFKDATNQIQNEIKRSANDITSEVNKQTTELKENITKPLDQSFDDDTTK